MEKLELKHWSIYLPFELKVEYYCSFGILKGVYFNCDTDRLMLQIKFADGQTMLIEHSNIKPVLWSLNDLTDEMVKDCGYISKEDMIRSIESGHVPYKIWVDLVSNDWDVHNLIPKGLAIDIKTLE